MVVNHGGHSSEGNQQQGNKGGKRQVYLLFTKRNMIFLFSESIYLSTDN